MSEISWPQVLSRLVAHEDLSTELARWAMSSIMTDGATSAQIASFVTALRSKGETANEIATFVDVLIEHANTVTIPGVAVDTCGTGGDGAHTVNISTMAAIVAASVGETIAKHGNRAASSKCGSADVLEELGVALELNPLGAAQVAADTGITFFFAPLFHPALRFAGPTRRELAIPTVFNILGPLANPAQPAAQVVGVAHRTLAPVMAAALAQRGTRALVVRSHDGLDEISTSEPTHVWDARTSDIVEVTLDAVDFGIARPHADSLRGDDAAFNARVVRDLFANVSSAALADIKNSVCLNAAAALVVADAARGHVLPLQTHMEQKFAVAVDAIENGLAAAKLEEWIAHSQRVSAAQ